MIHPSLFRSLRLTLLTSALLCMVFFVSLHYAAAAQSQQNTHTVSIKAMERSWIAATVDGVQRYFGVMAAGSEESWTGQSIVIVISNAGGVEISADGSFLGVLGTRSQVITLRWPDDAGRYPPVAASIATPTATRTPRATATPTRAVTTTKPLTATTLLTATDSVTVSAALTESTALTNTTSLSGTLILTVSADVPAIIYVVQPGDTLGTIAEEYGISVEAIQAANNISDPNLINVGWQLLIPNPDGTVGILPPDATPAVPVIVARGTITERMTIHAKAMSVDSPYSGTTWLTYYGRPYVPVMGILGEFDVDELTTKLQAEAAAYDAANGPDLTITPAYHLVHGMATWAPGDGSYLGFLDDETVMTYISKGLELNYPVILDVQIGALTPAQAISIVLPYLQYDNVHLGIDPEFAMVHPGQVTPGDPIGFVTAAQVNETQAVIQKYMEENNIPGQRVLLVHQFQWNMIHDKENLDYSYDKVALTLSVDGWGGPWGKISKYNSLVDETSPFVAFKLFYRWDEPLLDPIHAMGEELYPQLEYMGVTPNLIIYQ